MQNLAVRKRKDAQSRCKAAKPPTLLAIGYSYWLLAIACLQGAPEPTDRLSVW